MILVSAVDYCRCLLESAPQLLAHFLSYRAGLAILLVKVLQLMECRNHVFCRREFLGLLAQACLDLKILLEVVFSHLVVYLEVVVEFVSLELILFPDVRNFFGRNLSCLVPLLLQCLELVEMLAAFLAVLVQSLQFIDNLAFQYEVVLLFLFLLCKDYRLFVSDYLHLSLELLLRLAEHLEGGRLVGNLFGLLVYCLLFGVQDFVEVLFKTVQFIFGCVLGILCQNLYTLYDFLFSHFPSNISNVVDIKVQIK